MSPRERFIVLAVFMVILLATFLAAILVGLGIFQQGDPDLFKWLIGTGIAEILGAVIWAFRDSFRPKSKMSVNIVFPGKPPSDVAMDTEQCTYELRDGDSNQVKDKGKLIPTLGPGGWQCILPTSVSPTDYVKLFLTERDGDQWEVGWFVALVMTQQATQVH